MTLYSVLAVKDRAMDAYMQPFFTPSQGLAIRSFGDEVNNDQSPMNKHPDDYDLYALGVWNDTNGSFEQLPQPLCIARGKDFIVKPE